MSVLKYQSDSEYTKPARNRSGSRTTATRSTTVRRNRYATQKARGHLSSYVEMGRENCATRLRHWYWDAHVVRDCKRELGITCGRDPQTPTSMGVVLRKIWRRQPKEGPQALRGRTSRTAHFSEQELHRTHS